MLFILFRKKKFKICYDKYLNGEMYINYLKIKVIQLKREIINNIYIIAINKNNIEYMNYAPNLFD